MVDSNIVFFINNLDSGGIENYLLRFVQEKSGEFNNIYIYCKSGLGGQLEEEYKEIRNVIIIKQEISYFNFYALRKLKSFLLMSNISVVCDFTGNFSGLILRAAHKADIDKRIAFYRGSTDRFNTVFYKNIYNNIVKYLVEIHATQILSNSQAAFNYFFPALWKGDSRFDVVYNGINPESFLNETRDLREEFGIPLNAFVIGHTGRFNSAKNHETILKVAEILISKYDDIYFILCGNDVDIKLLPIIRSKGLGNRIITFGNRRDIPKFLNTMDCFFFPSLTEGQPNALIEAMVMGLPYVASNIDPIKETVFNFDELYPPKDVDAFVRALEYKYIYKRSKDINLQAQAINRFNSERCFNHFYQKLTE